MGKAQEAIKKIKKAQNGDAGSNVILIHETDAVYDDDTYELITPAVDEEFNIRMIVKGQATDKIIAKLTDNQQSYSLYLKGYIDKDINEDDWKIKFNGTEYAITFIDKTILSNVTIMHEILVKS